MQEDEESSNVGTSIHAGGDVIGVNIRGDKNIIGKNMNISQTSTEIKQITINQQILSKLDEDYAKAFKEIAESLTNRIKESKDVKSKQVDEIQKSLEDLAKESEGLSQENNHPKRKRKRGKKSLRSLPNILSRPFQRPPPPWPSSPRLPHHLASKLKADYNQL